jgi:succinyl-diaminopimelate desuccinylase
VHPLLGAPSASLNRIDGGTATNIVPDRCRAVLDLRTLPGQGHGSILVDLGMRAPAARLTVLRDAPAIVADPQGRLVTAARAASQQSTGREPALRGLPYVTDGSVFGQGLGAETVLVGPGDERLAHQADESVGLAELDAAVACYADIAVRMVLA